MKNKFTVYLCIIGLFVAIIFSNCATTRHYDFTLNNTLSIFLLNNGKDYYFCIPVQYMGEFQIDSFEYDNGYVLIGDYEIPLTRDKVNISTYLNEEAIEFGKSEGALNDETMNHYYIFIERYLTNSEFKKITNEYKKGNIYSKLYIGFDITIDGEQQLGSGMYDDFELYDGPAIDPAWFPENLDFFKAKYLR